MPFLDLLVFCMPAWVAEPWAILKPKENILRGAPGGSRYIAIAEFRKKGAPKTPLSKSNC